MTNAKPDMTIAELVAAASAAESVFNDAFKAFKTAERLREETSSAAYEALDRLIRSRV